MIEEDLSYLESKIFALEDKIDEVIRAVENDDFIWGVDSSYIQFQTKEEAQEWIDEQKSKDGKSFRKRTWLYGNNIDDVKPKRKLNL